MAFRGDDARRRRDHVLTEQPRRQHAGPAVEQHHHIGTRRDLRCQVRDRGLGQPVDQPGHHGRLAVGQPARAGEIRRATALDHVAGDREWSTREADQRHRSRQTAAHTPDRLEYRCDRLGQPSRIEPVDRGRARQWRKDRPLPLLERERIPERPGQNQDVAEQDRRIETEAPDRLKRHLRREIRRRAQRDEIPDFRPHRPILRQIAARLSHQPDGRRPDGFASQHPEHRLHAPVVIRSHVVAFLLYQDKRTLRMDDEYGAVDHRVPRSGDIRGSLSHNACAVLLQASLAEPRSVPKGWIRHGLPSPCHRNRSVIPAARSPGRSECDNPRDSPYSRAWLRSNG